MIRKTYTNIYAIIITLLVYFVFKYFLPNMYQHLSLFFNFYATFDQSTLSVPLFLALIPGIITCLHLRFKRIRIWDLCGAIGESLTGITSALALLVVLAVESFYYVFSFSSVIAFFIGIFTILPSVWFITLLFLLAYYKLTPKPKVFARKRKRRK